MVVLDNLPCHKRAGASGRSRRPGATVLFLPPYSPDLNPIELAFAKLKALLRAAERDGGRAVGFLGQSLDAFGPDECRNYFRHCGYAATNQ